MAAFVMMVYLLKGDGLFCEYCGINRTDKVDSINQCNVCGYRANGHYSICALVFG